MKRFVFSIIFITASIVALSTAFRYFLPSTYQKLSTQLSKSSVVKTAQTMVENIDEPPMHELAIEVMRKRDYPGSEITIERELPQGSNYKQYLTSYMSEGNKIYALLTVPTGEKPSSGWPVVVFNHGYIAPEVYRTTERYVAYQDAFARNGYIVFKSDYRGHGDSEGDPTGAYYSPGYTVDVLNAVSSIKKFKDADPLRIGMWGHSMGGHITLRSMVTTDDIKAGVIWAGVVGSYESMMNNWHNRRPTPAWQPSEREQAVRRMTRQRFIEQYGSPSADIAFWRSITPIYFIEDVSGPIQIHHGTADAEVPVIFSEELQEAMKAADKTSELYVYDGNDHNLSQSFNSAITRSVEFFDTYVKGL